MDDDSYTLDDDEFEITGTIGDLISNSIDKDEEKARAYVRESWIASTMAMLRRARWNANLTQQEIAKAVGTTQSSIARLERAEDTTLGRFWDYLDACGVAPTDIETIPTRTLVKYVQQQPKAMRSVVAVRSWLADETAASSMATRLGGNAAVPDLMSFQRLVVETTDSFNAALNVSMPRLDELARSVRMGLESFHVAVGSLAATPYKPSFEYLHRGRVSIAETAVAVTAKPPSEPVRYQGGTPSLEVNVPCYGGLSDPLAQAAA